MVKQESKIIRSKQESSTKKKYKGVRMRSWGSWVSEIRAPNQKTRIWLGSYSTAEAAARAYDAALLCLRGSKANINFPNSIPPISDNIMSPKAIQKIAAAAATADLLETSTDLGPHSPFSASSSSSSSSNEASVWIDDDPLSLAASATACDGDYSWYNFESPKYYDMMSNGVFFDPSIHDDYSSFEDAADIRLWSFC